TLPYLSELLAGYAKGKEKIDIDLFWSDKGEAVDAVEAFLSEVLGDVDFESYSKSDIVQLYENISLRKNVWLSFFTCQEMMKELDFHVLKQSRF
ncbi:MAG TPA: hypothetical protein VIN02_02180, partial [Sulfurovum sp.]